ncbi:MAG TPA: hypothetical protein VMM60_12455 [Ilumatobacter sp.]|nr:hypothetical protein [Ilumatobacter sp.]
MTSTGEPLRILAVCTANICRSPVAERLLARELAAVGQAAIVTSAGTHGGRLAVDEHSVRAAQPLGVDLRDHRSRLLTAELIEHDGADLIVTMSREHLREVVGLVPAAWPRTFTLRELARRANDLHPAGRAADSSLTFQRWLELVASGRKAADMMSRSDDDDLRDPHGGPFKGHTLMVADVAELTATIAKRIPHAPFN